MLQFCQFRQVNIQVREIITLRRVDAAIRGYQIPQQIVRNKTPGNEMVKFIIHRMKFLVCIYTMYWPANSHHHIPVIVLLRQRVSYFWANQFIRNGWNIWIAHLQEQSQVPISKIYQDIIMVVQILVP